MDTFFYPHSLVSGLEWLRSIHTICVCGSDYACIAALQVHSFLHVQCFLSTYTQVWHSFGYCFWVIPLVPIVVWGIYIRSIPHPPFDLRDFHGKCVCNLSDHLGRASVANECNRKCSNVSAYMLIHLRETKYALIHLNTYHCCTMFLNLLIIICLF